MFGGVRAATSTFLRLLLQNLEVIIKIGGESSICATHHI